VNSSELVSLENIEVHVISIEKWLELKAASNREKDSMHIDLFKESQGDGSKS